MASLVVSWTRMLEEVQATADERPLAEFEHDEAHFLRACPNTPRLHSVQRHPPIRSCRCYSMRV